MMTILAWISLPLAAGLLFFAVRAYRNRQGTRSVQALYSLAVVAAVGFPAYWNVLVLPL